MDGWPDFLGPSSRHLVYAVVDKLERCLQVEVFVAVPRKDVYLKSLSQSLALLGWLCRHASRFSQKAMPMLCLLCQHLRLALPVMPCLRLTPHHLAYLPSSRGLLEVSVF